MAPPSLLLLTPPPTSFDKASLKAAYINPLSAALIALASDLKRDAVAVLDIVVPCPHLSDQSRKPRSAIFKNTQHLLAGLYALISFIAVEGNIELDGPGGIDARILLLEDSSEKAEVLGRQVAGPVIDLGTLALTRKEWSTIFTVQSPQGQQLWNSYTALAAAQPPALTGTVTLVPGGTSIQTTTSSSTTASTVPTGTTIRTPASSPTAPSSAARTHQVVAVGGTFDHLHTGHKLLLTATALTLQPTKDNNTPLRLIIGITGDSLLVAKKFAAQLESWEEREANVISFLVPLLSFPLDTKSDIERKVVDEDKVNGQGVFTYLRSANLVIECIKIQDPFGPTITDQSVSALVVSGETRDGGRAVNEKRAEQGWEGLEVFEIDVLDERDGEEVGGATRTEGYAAKISSSVIRQRRAERAKQANESERKKSPSNL